MDKISSFPKLDSIALLNCVRIPVDESNKPKIIDQQPFSDFERIVMDNPFPVERKVNFPITDDGHNQHQRKRFSPVPLT